MLEQTPIYKWLKNRPTEKQALHNIRLVFKAPGIWKATYGTCSTRVNSANKDIVLPTKLFFDYLDVKVTIHHTDTVSVAVSCSFRPVLLELIDIIQLFEALTRTELYIANSIKNSNNEEDYAIPKVPCYRDWIVKMWHFGVDTIDEYVGKEFEVTFQEGMSDVYRIYSKQMKNGMEIVRTEHQEYPNQKAMYALVKKLFPNGKLIGQNNVENIS